MNYFIVPDHLGDVLAKTSENACVGDLATKFVSATGIDRIEGAWYLQTVAVNDDECDGDMLTTSP